MYKRNKQQCGIQENKSPWYSRTLQATQTHNGAWAWRALGAGASIAIVCLGMAMPSGRSVTQVHAEDRALVPHSWE